MLALTALASSDVCKEIKSSNLALVMRFAEDSEDQDLSAACNHFLALQAGNLTSQGRGRGQAYEEPASRAAGLGSQSVADSRPSGQGQGQGQGRSTIAASSLREAVQTSIVDVNRALQTVYPNTTNPSSLGLGQGTRHDSLRRQDLSQRTNDLDVRSARPLEDVVSSEDEDGDGLGGPHSHLDEEGDEDDFFMGQNLAQGKPYLKPRSGGIYSLLLKAQGGSGAATSPVQSSLGSRYVGRMNCLYCSLSRYFANAAPVESKQLFPPLLLRTAAAWVGQPRCWPQPDPATRAAETAATAAGSAEAAAAATTPTTPRERLPWARPPLSSIER